jgi:hypothetical protein
MLEVLDIDVKNQFHDDHVVAYNDIDALNDAYVRKKLLTNRTNAVVINGEYKLCRINNTYEEYVINTDYIISDTQVEEADRDRTKIYLIGPDKMYTY